MKFTCDSDNAFRYYAIAVGKTLDHKTARTS